MARARSPRSDAARRASWRKRSSGVVKKTRELSTLCGVAACAIIYGPDSPVPEVWPSMEGVTAVLQHLQSLPATEQTRKMMNQEKFLNDRIAKVEAQIARVERENNEAELLVQVFRCLGDPELVPQLDFTGVMTLGWTVEAKIRSTRDRIKLLQGRRAMATGALARPPASAAAAAAAADVFAGAELGDLEEGKTVMRREGVFNDYNPQLFWPEEDPTAVFSGGDDGGGYLQLPGVNAGGGSSLAGASSGDKGEAIGGSAGYLAWIDDQLLPKSK